MNSVTLLCLGALLFCMVLARPARAGDAWHPVEGRIMTRWAKDVDPGRTLPEYPRPQMVRKDWINLNGLWDYAITPMDSPRPERFDGKILVPFPIESALSGVGRSVRPEQRLWYRLMLPAPALAGKDRLLLHFGAVDYSAEVFINGNSVGRHDGGYDPFTIDITDALNRAGNNELVVAVSDPTDTHAQPRGKQVLEPHGIWYTAVTGIWQTVWLEPVPATSIKSLEIIADPGTSQIQVTVSVRGGNVKSYRTALIASLDGKVLAQANGDRLTIPGGAKRWSPDNPVLYDLRVRLDDADEKALDEVTTYVAFRDLAVRKDEAGVARIHLNDKPIFMLGPLDQGWWPDGLYTAPTDEALRFDIESMKRFGFNTCRKHIKVEPARWYYWCDKLGLMVWQDMPSGVPRGRGDYWVRGGASDDAKFSPDDAARFKRELGAMIEHLRDHPSIVAWVPFNEGWGQHDTNDILAWVKQSDPTRLVDGPSGWEDRGEGDMHDKHSYPGPDMFPPHSTRATILGEFGGLGLPIDGHLWWSKKNWGYRTFQSREELEQSYEQLYEKLGPLIDKGLSAAIYTQLTDVEGEVNGLLTYDRDVAKIDPQRLAEIHRRLRER